MLRERERCGAHTCAGNQTKYGNATTRTSGQSPLHRRKIYRLFFSVLIRRLLHVNSLPHLPTQLVSSPPPRPLHSLACRPSASFSRSSAMAPSGAKKKVAKATGSPSPRDLSQPSATATRGARGQPPRRIPPASTASPQRSGAATATISTGGGASTPSPRRSWATAMISPVEAHPRRCRGLVGHHGDSSRCSCIHCIELRK